MPGMQQYLCLESYHATLTDANNSYYYCVEVHTYVLNHSYYNPTIISFPYFNSLLLLLTLILQHRIYCALIYMCAASVCVLGSVVYVL